MPRGRKPKNQTVMENTETENPNTTSDQTETTESSEPIRYAGETCINHVQGEDFCIMYAGERKWYNWALQMVEEHPDEIEVLHHYDKQDKSIEIKIPYAVMSYIRWPNKREMSDEQKNVLRERMAKAREARGKK